MRWFAAALIVCFAAATALAYTAEQAKRGKQLFQQHCAACHGAEGRGGTVPSKYSAYAGMHAPAVAGPGGLPGMKTAGEVYEFIRKNMPLNAPGSLSDKDYIDIVAFDLKANNVAKPDNTPLTAEAAKKIKLGG